MSVINGYVLPGLPHPLLCPEKNKGYEKLRQGFLEVRHELEQSDADLIVIYSTMWPSVVGHQIQARKNPKWTHVDELFHYLGSIPYEFNIDQDFAHKLNENCHSRGLATRCVDYNGFPIDTGSVVALKMINPDNRIPAVILSSNVYADRAETVVFGKSVADTIKEQGKKVIAIAVSTLSNRLHNDFVEGKEDKIHSLKDNEWNLKVIEFLEKGRLEDVAQLSRQVHKEARVHKVNNFKSFWFLSALMGAHNRYTGKLYAYESVCGTGSAIMGLTPAARAARDLEFDEESPDTFVGDRNVLAPSDEFHADMNSQVSESEEM